MSYLKDIDKIKYDPELIQTIQKAAGIDVETQDLQQLEFGFKNDKILKFTNKNFISLDKKNMTQDEAARIEKLRQAIKSVSIVIAKIIIGSIIERFVDNKVNNLALKVVMNSESNKGLADFIEKEISKVYIKHPNYKICTLEQFKRTSIFEYVISEWRDKDSREIALQARKHIFDAALKAALAEGIPVPGSVVLMYPIKAALHYWGFDIGTSITELVVSYKSHCLSIGIHLRPIGYVLNNIVLYSFKDKNKLVATNLKDPPEDLYKITNEEAKKILKKYEDTSLIYRDINLIYSKNGM